MSKAHLQSPVSTGDLIFYDSSNYKGANLITILSRKPVTRINRHTEYADEALEFEEKFLLIKKIAQAPLDGKNEKATDCTAK